MNNQTEIRAKLRDMYSALYMSDQLLDAVIKYITANKISDLNKVGKITIGDLNK